MLGLFYLNVRKFANLGLTPKYTENLVYVTEVHLRDFIFGEQINLMDTDKNSSHSDNVAYSKY